MKIQLATEKPEDQLQWPTSSSEQLFFKNGRSIKYGSGYHREEDNVLCSFRFLALLALTFVVMFSLVIGAAFIYVSVQGIEIEEIVEPEEFWNDQPIIGILAQEDNEADGRSYIAASYIKFIEGGGGRVVPVMINRTQEYYDEVFKGINGLLLPGGGVYFNESGYATAGKYLLTLARTANDKGDHFPVWGTCLGMEYLVYEAAGDKDVLARCNAMNISTSLQFTKVAEHSKLFKRVPATVRKILSSQSVASNFHRNCLTEEVIKQHNLEKEFSITSWSSDPLAGPPFVSSLESKKYPIYGLQFHPEKNMYEWSWKKNIPHTSEAVLIGQYFAQFFINQARKSRHSFGSFEEERKHLIYNYNVTYTGGPNGAGIFEQSYFFPQ